MITNFQENCTGHIIKCVNQTILIHRTFWGLPIIDIFCMGFITAVMAGNDTFQQKSITQNRKTLITQPKHMIF